MVQTRSWLMMTVASVGFWAGTQAHGQTTGDATPIAVPKDTAVKPAESQGYAGDIVVTARRREERLVSVPVVVSAQSAAEIARYNAVDLSSIGRLTPSVIVGNYGLNGGGSIAIRGISSPANQTGFEQAVSVAIDGVQTSNGHIAQVGFFDLAQSEILKGPQALFFGKNSPAGVISLTTADPTPTFMAKVSGYYEFVGNETQVDGIVSGPLADNLTARIAVRYAYLDGWLRNSAGPIANPFYSASTGAPIGAATYPGAADPRPGSKQLLGRLTLKYEPSSDLTIRLKGFGTHARDPGAGVSLQNIGPCSGPNPRALGIADPYGECRADNRISSGDVPAVIGQTFPDFSKDGRSKGQLDVGLGVIDINKEFGKFTVSSITGYNYVRYKWFSSLDHTVYATVAEFEQTKEKAFSQEVRISSNFDGPLNVMIGAYYSNVDTEVHYQVKLDDRNYVAATGRFDSFEKVAKQNGKSISAFAQARWNIVDDVELAGGARYTHERKVQSQRNLYGIGIYNTLSKVFPDSIDKTPGVLASKFTDNNVSPEVTLAWHPDPNKTLFAAYKTGFKSGGFGLTNLLTVGSTVASIDTESEKARGFEVGAKGLFLNNRLRISAAAFAYRFSNLQVNIYDPVAIQFAISNAGAVKQRGAEFEANYRLNSNLTVHGAVAYVHNRFQEFVGQCYQYTFPTGATPTTATPPPNCRFANASTLTLEQDYSGRVPARSPSWSGNAGFVAEFPLGNHKLEFTGDAIYSGRYYTSETLLDYSRQNAFWQLNASINLIQSDDQGWRLGLVGRNLTNKYFVLYSAARTNGNGLPGMIGEQRAVVNRGRQIAVQASMQF